MGILNVKDRNTEFTNRFKLTDVDTGTSKTYDLEQVTGTITEVGTPINKALFDKIEYEIETSSAYEKINLDKIENANNYFNSTRDFNKTRDNQSILVNTPFFISKEITFDIFPNAGSNSANSSTTTQNRIITMFADDTTSSNVIIRIGVYDKKDGSLINEQTIQSEQTNGYYFLTSCVALKNNNILATWIERNAGGYFMIIDENGNIVKEKTLFDSSAQSATTGTLPDILWYNAILLNNGNVFIGYVTPYPTFMIIDQNGNVVKEKTRVYADTATMVCVSKFDNGNVLYSYVYSKKIYYLIFSQDGEVLVSRTILHSAGASKFFAIPFDNENVFLAKSSSESLYMYICDLTSGTASQKGSTMTLSNNYIGAAKMNEREMVVFFRENSNNTMFKYIVDKDGNVSTATQVFSESCTYITANRSDIGDIIVNFTDWTNKKIVNYVIPYINASSENTINGIQIDTILKGDSYYELVYKKDQNKFLAFERRA